MYICVCVCGGASQVALVVKKLPANSINVTDPQVLSRVDRIPWRRVWQSAPVLLAGEYYGQRNLAGYGPQSQSWTQQKRLNMHMHLCVCVCVCVHVCVYI